VQIVKFVSSVSHGMGQVVRSHFPHSPLKSCPRFVFGVMGSLPFVPLVVGLLTRTRWNGSPRWEVLCSCCGALSGMCGVLGGTFSVRWGNGSSDY
jgi:hypothetical protein